MLCKSLGQKTKNLLFGTFRENGCRLGVALNCFAFKEVFDSAGCPLSIKTRTSPIGPGFLELWAKLAAEYENAKFAEIFGMGPANWP